MYNKKVINVLSLGVGVQSTAMLLKYQDEIDFAVFADTEAEPLEVYKMLKTLQKKVKTKIIIASRGNMILEPKKYGFSTAPLFYTKPDGKSGMGRRFCTSLYKIQVVDKAVRKELGYKKYARMKHKIRLWIGISTDEEGRVKDSKEKWKEKFYPLIRDNLSRQDCIKIVEKETGIIPTRSACVFCPYKKDEEFAQLSKEDFKMAVDFDNSIRDIRKGVKQYVHRSLKPLSDVDLGKKKVSQYSFEQHCDGGCGL